MTYINLKDVTVSYDGKTNILKKLNLDIKKGELVSLLGSSGCGKTTTLRVIAGFITPNEGQFVLDGEEYTNIPVHKRNFGLVFQSYALFPHLTVFENVAFGLKMQKVDKKEIEKRVMEMLETVDLKGFEKRLTKELSGGQRQRVALARALVINPKILLLDEPLSNLDAKLRVNMRVEIRRLQQKLGITTVFVTHDQEECFSISDKVAVMNGGVIEQYDTPEKIYAHPNSEFVARFIGFENFIELKELEDKVYESKDGVKFLSTYDKNNNSDKILGTIRPDDIKILSDNSEEKENIVDGQIEVRTYLGKDYQYSVKTNLGNLTVNSQKDVMFEKGDKVRLFLPSNKLILV